MGNSGVGPNLVLAYAGGQLKSLEPNTPSVTVFPGWRTPKFVWYVGEPSRLYEGIDENAALS